jgi:hypothetical protein
MNYKNFQEFKKKKKNLTLKLLTKPLKKTITLE